MPIQKMRSESAIEQSFSRWCKKQGLLCFKLSEARGVPDRLVLRDPETMIFIEFKKPGGVMSRHQDAWRDMLTEKGFNYCVATSREEAIEQVEDVIARIPN